MDAAKQLLERLLTDHLPVHTQARTLEPRTCRCDMNGLRSLRMNGDHGVLQLNERGGMARTAKAFRTYRRKTAPRSI